MRKEDDNYRTPLAVSVYTYVASFHIAHSNMLQLVGWVYLLFVITVTSTEGLQQHVLQP